MSSRQKSNVWTYFEKCPAAKKVKCKLCKAELADCNNTSNMLKHVKARHTQEAMSMTADESQEESTTTKRQKMEQQTLHQATQHLFKYKKDAPRQKQLTEKLMRMIVKDMQPFSMVEDEGFKDLLHALDPKFDIPCRTTMSRHYLKELYAKEAEALKTDLAKAEYIALTTDGWTSRQTVSYLTVTCHYITDEWKLKSATLDTVHMKREHTAENIADEIKAICVSWGIESKIVSVVTDGASNMIAAIRTLGQHQMPCFAHMLNLVVKGALDESELAPLRRKVREIVTYFHHSVKASDCLREIQSQSGQPNKKLIAEVETRWNSTYDMLERYHEQHQAVTKALCYVGRPSLCIEDREVQQMKSSLEILRPFEDVTREFSAEKYDSLSKVITLCQVLRRKMTGHDATSPLAQKLLDNLDRRFRDAETRFHLAASALRDPRFKKLAFSSPVTLEATSTRLVAEMTSIMPDPDPEQGPSTDAQDVTATDNLWSHFDDLVASTTTKRTQTVNTEIEKRRYFEDENIPRNSDPLEYWRKSENIFPRLSKLAKNICAFQHPPSHHRDCFLLPENWYPAGDQD